MPRGKFLDALGSTIAGLTLLGSTTLFYTNTGAFVGSFVAGLMTAALVWSTYIILKWLVLANRQ